MFTGIIESVGKITSLHRAKGNLVLKIQSSISGKLRPGQSVNHDGVCLTVVSKGKNTHIVVAVEETLNYTTLGKKKIGDLLNLERAMKANGRFEGHIVQGHIDTTGGVERIENKNGSHQFTIAHRGKAQEFVHRGSTCINGVSLTIAKYKNRELSVAIIPYTFEHTTFKDLKAGDTVNIECDVIGKYLKAFTKRH